jgi:hypothetical protein
MEPKLQLQHENIMLRERNSTQAADSAWEFHAIGKQLDLPKLTVKLLNGNLP